MLLVVGKASRSDVMLVGTRDQERDERGGMVVVRWSLPSSPCYREMTLQGTAHRVIGVGALNTSTPSNRGALAKVPVRVSVFVQL